MWKIKHKKEAKYLGCFINDKADTAKELKKRMGECNATWKRLEAFWKHSNCDKADSVGGFGVDEDVLDLCVFGCRRWWWYRWFFGVPNLPLVFGMCFWIVWEESAVARAREPLGSFGCCGVFL